MYEKAIGIGLYNHQFLIRKVTYECILKILLKECEYF